MTLLIFALILLFLLIIIPIIWKIFTFMLSFMIELPFMILSAFYTKLCGTSHLKGYVDPDWKHTVVDESSIWVKGENGRYFRYVLNLPDAEEVQQAEQLNRFYRDNLIGIRSK